MKIYCALLINELSGEIEHCATSDAPISDTMIPEPDGTYEGPRTIPLTGDKMWRKCFCEFESEFFTRGRSVITDFVMSGSSPAERANIAAQIQLRPGITKYTSLKETTELQMKADYAAL